MRILILLLGLFFLVLFSGEVMAKNVIGVSPGTVGFKDVIRGGYAERYLTITAQNVEGEIFISAQPRGEIADWLEYYNNVSVAANRPGRFFVAVRPPKDIPNGNYTGFLRISTGALASAPGGPAVTNVKAVLDVAISVEITDLEIQKCAARGFSIRSAEKGDDAIFDFNIYNQGNVRLSPLIILEIWDQEQLSLVKTLEFRANDILPTKEQGGTYRIKTGDLDIGQYWINIKVPDCFSDGFLTFDVLEPGALRSEGILQRIYSLPWSKVGDTIPIIAEFKNIGEKDVLAKFKGKITLDGKVVRVLESEEINVPVLSVENFTFFFTPNEPGSYVASGRVFYDKKRTFETSGVFNVAPKTFSFKNIILVIVYFVLMVAIAFLLYRVHKERKKYSWKIRRIRYG